MPQFADLKGQNAQNAGNTGIAVSLLESCNTLQKFTGQGVDDHESTNSTDSCIFR